MRWTRHRSGEIRTTSALLLFGFVAACGTDDAAGDPAGAFTFAADDLCEWVSPTEVAEFYASVYEWEGTAELSDVAGAEPDECWWALGRHRR